jgi:hypothetical protein
LDPIGSFRQMVERTEEQHCVGTFVGESQHSRIARFSTRERIPALIPGRASCLRDVERDRIDQMDAVPSSS